MQILRALPAVWAGALAAAPLAAQPAPNAVHRAPSASSLAARARAVPGTQRYYFIPTGRTLPAGTVEIGDYQFLAPYVGYSLHDRVMIAAGTPLAPEALGRLWYFAPKIGVLAGERWNAAVGGLIFAAVQVDPLAGIEPLETRSVGWGVVTRGGAAGSVTLGAATEGAAPWDVPEGWLVLTGAELRLVGDDRAQDPTVARALYEGYIAPSQHRPLEGVHLLGLRMRADRVAFEVMMPITVRRHEIIAHRFPLIHLSILF